jgi:predicted dehydrogenase
LICEWIWDGAIGEVREVDAWCSLSYYNWGYPRFSPDWWRKPLEDKPALPEGLEWDLWLGPARERSYQPAYHPASWRCWWDFGSGMMGDRGAHTLACVHDAMKLGHVESVDAANLGTDWKSGKSPYVHPVSALVTYRFPERGNLPPLTVRWYEGMNPPCPPELEDGRKLPPEGGVIFRGMKGAILAGWKGDSPRIVPEAAMKAYQRPPKTLPRVKGTHQQAWIRACKEGKQPSSHFGVSGPLTELVQLGNVAKRYPQNRLLWDGEKMEVTNHKEANEWVRRPYRKGWSL